MEEIRDVKEHWDWHVLRWNEMKMKMKMRDNGMFL